MIRWRNRPHPLISIDHRDQQQKANAKAPMLHPLYEHQGFAWSEVRTQILTIRWFLSHRDNIFGRCGGASFALSSSAQTGIASLSHQALNCAAARVLRLIAQAVLEKRFQWRRYHQLSGDKFQPWHSIPDRYMKTEKLIFSSLETLHSLLSYTWSTYTPQNGEVN